MHPGARACGFRFRFSHVRTHTHTHERTHERTQPGVIIDISDDSSDYSYTISAAKIRLSLLNISLKSDKDSTYMYRQRPVCTKKH